MALSLTDLIWQLLRFVDDSSSEEESSEQEETKVLKCQAQKQECDTSQRPSEDKRRLSHCHQRPSQAKRSEQQRDNRLTGNEQEKPDKGHSVSTSQPTGNLNMQINVMNY